MITRRCSTWQLPVARVLNAQAVEFARKAGIQILARKTSDTGGRQTDKFGGEVQLSHVAAVVGAPHCSMLQGNLVNVNAILSGIEKLGATVLGMGAVGEPVILVNRALDSEPRPETLSVLAGNHGLEIENERV